MKARAKAIAAFLSLVLLYAAMYEHANKYVSAALVIYGALGVHAIPNAADADQLAQMQGQVDQVRMAQEDADTRMLPAHQGCVSEPPGPLSAHMTLTTPGNPPITAPAPEWSLPPRN
jgi:hypothetical protein